MLIKLLIIAVLAAIVVSLGSGLFYLAREGDSRRMVRALSWRIGLSIALFLLLLLAWSQGLLQPHGLLPSPP